jgi:hypothetical protein
MPWVWRVVRSPLFTEIALTVVMTLLASERKRQRASR